MARRLAAISRTFAALAAAAIGVAASARAQSPAPKPTGSYSVQWAVSAVPGTGWADSFDFHGVPVSTKITECGEIGLIPAAGLHIVDADPGWKARHLAKLAQDIDRMIPNAGYDGFAAIPRASWSPVWNRAADEPSDLPPDAEDRDFKTDWREYLRATRPQLLANLTEDQQERVFQATYEDAARSVLLVTIQECKRLRPAARWGIIGLPDLNSAAPGSAAEQLLADDDRLRPLWDACDALFPALGLQHEGAAPAGQTVCDAVRESVRLAAAKPVYPFLAVRYGGGTGRGTGEPETSDLFTQADLGIMLSAPRQCGAAGIVVWDFFSTQRESIEFREYFDRTLGPQIVAASSGAPMAIPTYQLGGLVRQADGRLVVTAAESGGTTGAPTQSLWPGEPSPSAAAKAAPAVAAATETDPDPARATTSNPTAGSPTQTQKPVADARPLLGPDGMPLLGPDGKPQGKRFMVVRGSTVQNSGRPAPAIAHTPTTVPAPPAKGSTTKPLPTVVRTVPERDFNDPAAPPITVPPKNRKFPPWVYVQADDPSSK